ncbi:tetratricopeptide repeat protein [Mesorhizobium sp. CC13]|uniref:tetratricopeptide repeat protein n=1 Tax=Mesorhizobium sp. CC13 TaxID=3029194 RepID=UPI003265F2F7
MRRPGLLVAMLCLGFGLQPAAAVEGGLLDPADAGAVPALGKPAETIDPSRFGPAPAEGAAPATKTTPAGQPGAAPASPSDLGANPAAKTPDGIDPNRFGGKATDEPYGAFQRGLYKTAYNLGLPRAEAGDAAAQTLIAEILSRGLGMPRNDTEAARWYQRAAEQGVPEAQFQYALLLLDGKYVTRDEKAATALMQAAAEAGNRFAQFNYAQMLVQREAGEKGLVKAVPYYERSAETGLADAQYAMAQVYANGVGGKLRDDRRARLLLVQAARQNYDTAQFDLSLWMVDGRGGDRDLKSAFGWMKLAADSGNVAARNRLAKFYMGGIGVEPDPILAGAWYIVARRAGLTDPEMDDFLRGLTDDEMKQALERANRIR